MMGEAEPRIRHLLFGVVAVPGVERDGAAAGVRHHEGLFTGGDDGEAAGMIAALTSAKSAIPSARHVVVVARLTKLLGRIDLDGDRATRCFVDRFRPRHDALDMQRMRWRREMREPQGNGFVLSKMP